MIDLIDRGASALILLQGGQTPEDASLSGVAKVQQIVAESARGKVEPPLLTGALAAFEAKVAEAFLNVPVLSDLWLTSGTSLPGDGLAEALGERLVEHHVQRDRQGENGIHAGDDEEWEAAVARDEWRMKSFLSDVINYNDMRLFEETMRIKCEKSIMEFLDGLKGFGRMGQQMQDRLLRRESKGPGDAATRMSVDEKLAEVSGAFAQLAKSWGVGDHISLNERGFAQIRKGDYLTTDGRRYMEIREDGSITTFNADGSIRRSETLTELMERSFDRVSAYRLKAADNLSVRFY